MRLAALPFLLFGILLAWLGSGFLALWLGIVITATAAVVLFERYLSRDPHVGLGLGGEGGGDCGGGGD